MRTVASLRIKNGNEDEYFCWMICVQRTILFVRYYFIKSQICIKCSWRKENLHYNVLFISCIYRIWSLYNFVYNASWHTHYICKMYAGMSVFHHVLFTIAKFVHASARKINVAEFTTLRWSWPPHARRYFHSQNTGIIIGRPTPTIYMEAASRVSSSSQFIINIIQRSLLFFRILLDLSPPFSE